MNTDFCCLFTDVSDRARSQTTGRYLSKPPRRINPITDPVGSDQTTKSDGIPGNKSTNGSDGSALFSLYVLINILVNTRELYSTIISYRIPIVGPNQIRWKILH